MESQQLREQLEEESELTEAEERVIEKEEIRQLKEYKPWLLDKEEIVLTDEKIGVGAYGEVRVALFRGTRVAAKCLHRLIVSDYNRGVFIGEMEVSSRMRHKNIVQFVGATYNRENNPILLYELMDTSLLKKLEKSQPLSWPNILDVCCDIGSALCYLHQWRPKPITHRDVSSANVLMEPLAKGRWRSKLADFGSANLSLQMQNNLPEHPDDSHTPAMNPAYAAPEAANPILHTPAMDVYSFGVLITEMVYHLPPEMTDAKRQQQAHEIDWKPMRVLVLKCIKNDHTQRPTSVQVLEEVKLHRRNC